MAERAPGWEIVLGTRPTVGLRELLAACDAKAVSR
jgi:hypothetical protein